MVMTAVAGVVILAVLLLITSGSQDSVTATPTGSGDSAGESASVQTAAIIKAQRSLVKRARMADEGAQSAFVAGLAPPPRPITQKNVPPARLAAPAAAPPPAQPVAPPPAPPIAPGKPPVSGGFE